MKIAPILTLFILAIIYPIVGFGRPQDERPISLQVSSLSKWISSPEALAIQMGLSVQFAKDRISTELQQIRTTKKTPFLLLETERNNFGDIFCFSCL